MRRDGCSALAIDAMSPAAAGFSAEALAAQLKARAARVGVIGLGYVGLPLLRAVIEAGFPGLGLDINPERVESLVAGRSYVRQMPDELIAKLHATGRFEASTDFGRLAGLDVVLICVPTPLTRHREPDLSFVVSTTEVIARHLRNGQLVILESTTYPGTTSEVLQPILERSGLRADEDFFLAYSPEREDPGNEDFDIRRIPKVVGGVGKASTSLAKSFYREFVSRAVVVSSPAAAEAVKLTENIFRAVNIALVNELKVVYDAMDIDIWEVIEAARTKPFGYMPFYPGPGLGGHCIPIDPFYLTWKAREHDIATRFIELAGEVNVSMPHYVVERLAQVIDRRFAKGLNGARILIIGLAYKKNVDDMRESPALTIMDQLEKRGAQIAYHDPYLPVIPSSREYSRFAGRRSTALSLETIAAYDAVLIVTDHDGIDYAGLVAAAQLVVDTRNATGRVHAHRDKIVRA